VFDAVACCFGVSNKGAQLGRVFEPRAALNAGMEARFEIETPLMKLNKAETWALAESLGGEPLVDLIRHETHTCYVGDRSTENEWGWGCGACPACDLRRSGYLAFRGCSGA